MPEQQIREIANAADVIVDGYALLRTGETVKVVNLDTGNVAVFSGQDEMLESSMPEIELAIALKFLKSNKQFMES